MILAFCRRCVIIRFRIRLHLKHLSTFRMKFIWNSIILVSKICLLASPVAFAYAWMYEHSTVHEVLVCLLHAYFAHKFLFMCAAFASFVVLCFVISIRFARVRQGSSQLSFWDQFNWARTFLFGKDAILIKRSGHLIPRVATVDEFQNAPSLLPDRYRSKNVIHLGPPPKNKLSTVIIPALIAISHGHDRLAPIYHRLQMPQWQRIPFILTDHPGGVARFGRYDTFTGWNRTNLNNFALPRHHPNHPNHYSYRLPSVVEDYGDYSFWNVSDIVCSLSGWESFGCFVPLAILLYVTKLVIVTTAHCYKKPSFILHRQRIHCIRWQIILYSRIVAELFVSLAPINQFICITRSNKPSMILLAAKIIAAGLATISLIGAGVGIGNVFGSFLIAISRNPLLLKTLFTYTILGFALVEAIALFGLMMAFLLLFGL